MSEKVEGRKRERESLIKKYIHTQNDKSISFTFVTDKTKH